MGTLTKVELQDEVRKYLANRTSEDDRLVRCIDLAQMRIARRHRWEELEGLVSKAVLPYFTDNPIPDSQFTGSVGYILEGASRSAGWVTGAAPPSEWAISSGTLEKTAGTGESLVTDALLYPNSPSTITVHVSALSAGSLDVIVGQAGSFILNIDAVGTHTIEVTPISSEDNIGRITLSPTTDLACTIDYITATPVAHALEVDADTAIEFSSVVNISNLNIRDIYSVIVTNNSDRARKLKYVIPGQFDTYVRDQDLFTRHFPSIYTVYGKRKYLRLHSPPDAQYSRIIKYSAWPTSFASLSDTDVSDLDQKDDMIITLAASYLYHSLGKREDAKDLYAIYAGMFNEAVGEEVENPDLDILPASELARATGGYDPGGHGPYYADPFNFTGGSHDSGI